MINQVKNVPSSSKITLAGIIPGVWSGEWKFGFAITSDNQISSLSGSVVRGENWIDSAIQNFKSATDGRLGPITDINQRWAMTSGSQIIIWIPLKTGMDVPGVAWLNQADICENSEISFDINFREQLLELFPLDQWVN